MVIVDVQVGCIVVVYSFRCIWVIVSIAHTVVTDRCPCWVGVIDDLPYMGRHDENSSCYGFERKTQQTFPFLMRPIAALPATEPSTDGDRHSKANDYGNEPGNHTHIGNCWKCHNEYRKDYKQGRIVTKSELRCYSLLSRTSIQNGSPIGKGAYDFSMSRPPFSQSQSNTCRIRCLSLVTQKGKAFISRFPLLVIHPLPAKRLSAMGYPP